MWRSGRGRDGTLAIEPPPRVRASLQGYHNTVFLKRLKAPQTLKFLRSVAPALLVSGRIYPYTGVNKP
jgi:hypothetical protein